MMDDPKMEFARLLRDKQLELSSCRDHWARSARSLIRMLMDGSMSISKFDTSAFSAAVEDLLEATAAITPVEEQARELKARLL